MNHLTNLILDTDVPEFEEDFDDVPELDEIELALANFDPTDLEHYPN